MYVCIYKYIYIDINTKVCIYKYIYIGIYNQKKIINRVQVRQYRVKVVEKFLLYFAQVSVIYFGGEKSIFQHLKISYCFVVVLLNLGARKVSKDFCTYWCNEELFFFLIFEVHQKTARDQTEDIMKQKIYI